MMEAGIYIPISPHSHKIDDPLHIAGMRIGTTSDSCQETPILKDIWGAQCAAVKC